MIEPGGQLTIFRPPEGEEIVRVMDREQEALAKSMGEGHRVVRVAGSGKTLILVYRAKLFAELQPRQTFLVTCFTHALASQLRAYLANHPNVEVCTLGTLVHQAIREAGLDDPGYEDDSGEERAAAGLRALEQGALTRYRAVFVDEAQDFGTNALRFAVSLADERFNDVLVVADAAQNVFRRRFNWKQAGIQAQGRTRILRKNYRNTREILELAYSFLVPAGDGVEALDLEDENAIVPPEAALRSGSIPRVVLCDPRDLVVRAIEETKQLVTAKSAPKQLGLLTMGNQQAIDLARLLRSESIEYFFVSDPKHRTNRDRVASAEAPVILSTVYGAKGLEFPDVVVCCTPRDGQEPDALRSAIYVGMTRATERLVVVAEQNHALVTISRPQPRSAVVLTATTRGRRDGCLPRLPHSRGPRSRSDRRDAGWSGHRCVCRAGRERPRAPARGPLISRRSSGLGDSKSVSSAPIRAVMLGPRSVVRRTRPYASGPPAPSWL